MLIGQTVPERYPVYAQIVPHSANEVSYCCSFGFQHFNLSNEHTGIVEIELVEPFCDVNTNMASQTGMDRLRTVICYVAFCKREQNDIQGYVGFEEDLVTGITTIREGGTHVYIMTEERKNGGIALSQPGCSKLVFPIQRGSRCSHQGPSPSPLLRLLHRLRQARASRLQNRQRSVPETRQILLIFRVVSSVSVESA
jgi:hypothetical protein